MTSDTHISSSEMSRIAIQIAIAGIFLFAALDAAMKGLSLEVGVFTTLFARVLIGTLLSAVLYFFKWKGKPTIKAIKLHALRAILSAFIALMFFWGLVRVPLAQAVGLTFIAPLIALYLAAVLLKENITGRAVKGSVIALAGVFVVIGGKFHIGTDLESILGTVAILLAAAGYAYYLIIQRMQALVASPFEVAFFQNFFVAIVLLPAMPIFFTMPTDRDIWAGLFIAAVLAIGSVLLMSAAYRRAETRELIVIEYTAFVWAVLFGWLLFSESVSATTFIGTGCIIFGCVFSSDRVVLPWNKAV